MNLTRASATLSLLLILLLAPCLCAHAQNSTSPYTSPATRTLTPPAAQSPRQTLITHLQSPNLALTLVGIGALLLLLECNLPGAILPGALGLLLLLSGIFGLSLHPLRPSAILLLLLSSIALAISARLPLLGIPALLGTAGLTFALHNLTAGVSTSIAVAIGLSLGLATTLLGRVAWIARRNKILLPPRPSQLPRAPTHIRLEE